MQIRGYLKLRPYAHREDDAHLTEYLLARALQRNDPAILLKEAEDWLREEGISFRRKDHCQIIAEVRPQAESQVFRGLDVATDPNPGAGPEGTGCSVTRASVVRPSPG